MPNTLASHVIEDWIAERAAKERREDYARYLEVLGEEVNEASEAESHRVECTQCGYQEGVSLGRAYATRWIMVFDHWVNIGKWNFDKPLRFCDANCLAKWAHERKGGGNA